MTTSATAILRLLIARYEANSFSLAWLRLDWLERDSGLDHEQVLACANELIELGLAETEGLLVRALMPAAREALVFKGNRLRLSALASS